tara:strand:+ start:2803 stop:3012 length:210 start_codon:yes stop_codon:yes gene_type:complete
MMLIGEQIEQGDLIKAHGGLAMVLEVIPANPRLSQSTPRIRILSEDGRCWVTRLAYTQVELVSKANERR